MGQKENDLTQLDVADTHIIAEGVWPNVLAVDSTLASLLMIAILPKTTKKERPQTKQSIKVLVLLRERHGDFCSICLSTTHGSTEAFTQSSRRTLLVEEDEDDDVEDEEKKKAV